MDCFIPVLEGTAFMLIQLCFPVEIVDWSVQSKVTFFINSLILMEDFDSLLS